MTGSNIANGCLVFFDLDDTLTDRQQSMRRWAEEISQRLCVGLPSAVARRIVEMDSDGSTEKSILFEKIISEFGSSAGSADDLRLDYERATARLTQTTDGAIECLKVLRSTGWMIVVVTDGRVDRQRLKLEVTGLNLLVDALIDTETSGLPKPHESAFIDGAQAVGGHLDGAWVVGDSPQADIGAAARLGLRSIWLRRGRKWSISDFRPTAEINHLSEVPGVLSLKQN